MPKLKTMIAVILSCVAGGVIVQTGMLGAEAQQSPTAFVPVDSYGTFDTGTMGNKTRSGSIKVVYPELHLVAGEAIQFPAEAVAVAYNVTVTETEGAGFLEIDTLPLDDAETSNVNWTEDGQTVANSGITRIQTGDDGSLVFGILMGGTDNARAHILVDITGYFVET